MTFDIIYHCKQSLKVIKHNMKLLRKTECHLNLYAIFHVSLMKICIFPYIVYVWQEPSISNTFLPLYTQGFIDIQLFILHDNLDSQFPARK